ncbi:hypothetical protein FACS189440_21620 [Bacteroidia bacterium]|nr:hypothetical protein FACS189440_21620 [Bacteroidia bacterium]
MAFLSCSQKDTKTERTREAYSPEIDLDRNDQVSIADFVESTDVVQLETTDSCFIKRIDKIIYDNDRYYVFDREQAMLFCFDSLGKLLFKINSKGQGPEEYLTLDGFDIDNYNQQLLLIEPFGHLLTFDLNGKFISKIRLPQHPPAYNEVYALDKDKVLLLSATEKQLFYFSRGKNEMLDVYNLGFNDIKSTLNLTSIFRRIYQFDETLFYTNAVYDRIINLSDTTGSRWDFGEMTNAEKQINSLLDEYKREITIEKFDRDKTLREASADHVAKKKLHYELFLCHETSRYKICFLYRGNHRISHIFYDKKNGSYSVFDKTNENIEFRFNPVFSGESLIQNSFAGFSFYLNPGNYQSVLNAKWFDRELLTEEQRAIIDSHQEDDNPYLIKYNFKQ